MATNTKSSVVRVKPSGGDGSISSSTKPRFDSSSSVTKKRTVEISSHKQSADAKGKTISKTEVKVNAKATSSSSKTVKKTVTRTREKKVYSLPGQKFDVPEEREPLRLFYESLSKQIPSSEMAEFWLMEHGLLSPDRAKKAFEKKQRKQKQLRTGTPIKSPTRPVSIGSSKQPQQASKNGEIKAKKRLNKDSDDDDDFILSPKRRKG
nr:Ubiquitin carboxyl-terminal hydrolase FAF [Ipomoea batatas]